ncbi:MAG: hypothetical protein HYX75_10945 [Acidobacteria bacterium]|nr:hypothetical protein [Acidobacteriota bacterium]
MKKGVFLGALGLLALHAGDGGARPPRLEQWESDQIAAEIRVLNIVNQLHLTDDQLDRILPLSREDVAEREQLIRKRDEAEPALMAAAIRLRQELASGFNSTPGSEDAWQRVHGPLLDAFLDYREMRHQRIEQVMEVLTPNQTALISQYQPCVVPIKDYKDPARIGQAASSSIIEKHLGRVREMPESQFDYLQDRIRERVAEKLRLHYRAEEIPAKVEEFVRAARDVREMSELEFEAKKSGIAERLAPPEPFATGQALEARVGEFLLSPEALSILEHRSGVR